MNTEIQHVYFENPIMHGWAAETILRMAEGWFPKPSQIIQPCDFGHPETKATGLWLHKLPLLTPTKIVRNEMALLPKKERSRVHYASPGPDRWNRNFRKNANRDRKRYGFAVGAVPLVAP